MIGERLKEIRKDRGDTQAAMARKLHVALSTVKSWEGERSSPDHATLVEICRMYDVSADFLLGLTDEDPLFLSHAHPPLSPENQQQMRLFEGYLVYLEQNK